MQKETLLTIDVSHGTTHDGPGMRTTVFVKGCPLHCLWCQNPESIGIKNEVWWSQPDCIGCESCMKACPNSAIFGDERGIHVDRTKCAVCGTCADTCPSSAMSRQGEEYTMDKLMREVLKDRLYYKQFGGGVTCSGGEPLLQYEFVSEFFMNLQAEGISTALDTCGCAPQKNLEAILPYTNYILYDMKIFDSDKHKEFTGAENKLILENLLYAAEYVRRADHPMEIWIRTPLIPGATAYEENIAGIGEFIRDNILDVVTRWEMCAFNGVCTAKYDKLDMKWAYDGQGAMAKSEIEPLKQTALKYVSEEKLLVTGMVREDA
ncbi:MAG: glycyl-radical enzyme activating protein [Ruminococcaceae bacterium]|nr:glycyl-radical enzyme activating protein [Oscillospiraceae bacterium]